MACDENKEIVAVEYLSILFLTFFTFPNAAIIFGRNQFISKISHLKCVLTANKQMLIGMSLIRIS